MSEETSMSAILARYHHIDADHSNDLHTFLNLIHTPLKCFYFQEAVFNTSQNVESPQIISPKLTDPRAILEKMETILGFPSPIKPHLQNLKQCVDQIDAYCKRSNI